MSSRRPRNAPTAGSETMLSSKERMQLAVMFLVGLVVAVVYISSIGNDPTRDVPGTGETQPDPVVGDVTMDTGTWAPPIERLNEMFEGIGPDLARPEALKILVPLVANRAHFKFKHDPDYAKVGGFERVPVSRLADPAASNDLRGKPIEITGTLKAYEWIDPQGTFDLGNDTFRYPTLLSGTVEVEGQRVHFLDVQSGSGERDLLLPLNTRFKVMGVFYRLREFPHADGTEVQPFILATRATEAVPLRVLEELPADLGQRLADVEATDIERSPHRDPAFMDALGFALSDAGKALAASATEVLEGKAPLQHPEDYRLRPVRVEGALAYLQRESFEYLDMRPEDAPVLAYWHAIIARWAAEEHTPISVMIPDGQVPQELIDWSRLPKNDRRRYEIPKVELAGLFLRTHAFEAKGGERVRHPMVVALEAPKFEFADTRGPDDTNFMLGFIAVGVVVAGGLTIMLVRDRKRSRRTFDHLRERRQKRTRERDLPRGVK